MAEKAGKLGALYLARRKALAFDGTADYVTVSDAASLDFTSGVFSIAFWGRFGVTTAGLILDKYDTDTGYKIEVTGNKIVFTCGDGTNEPEIIGTTDVNDDLWHHIVVVRDGTNINLYVDGSSDQTAVTDTSGDTDNAVDLKLGASGAAFTGRLGEIQIWGAAKTSAEVTAMWNSGDGVFGETDSNTKMLLRVCEGTGATVKDETDYKNNGTITNALWSTHENSVTNETPSGTIDGSNKTYQLANGNVDNLSCTVDGSGVGASGYTVSVKGEIIFVVAPTASVSVDYDYYVVSSVGCFHSWSIDHVGEALETTDFGSAGHRTYLTSLDGWAASAERHWVDSGLVPLIGSDKLIIQFYTDETGNKRWQGWAYVTGVSPACPVDALVSEALSFQGTGLFEYV